MFNHIKPSPPTREEMRKRGLKKGELVMILHLGVVSYITRIDGHVLPISVAGCGRFAPEELFSLKWMLVE